MTALREGDRANAPLDDAERQLLGLVETVTLHANRTTPEQIEQLRQAGWSDEQIAETVYVTAMFAMFNRVSDAFGLQDPQYLERAAQGEPPPKPASQAKPAGQ